MLKASLKNLTWDLKKNTFCVEVAKAFKRNNHNCELNWYFVLGLEVRVAFEPEGSCYTSEASRRAMNSLTVPFISEVVLNY